MTETYLVAAFHQAPVDSELFESQSFKPVASHFLEYIDLDLASVWITPRPIVKIFKAAWGGWPTGPKLTASISHTPSKFFPGKVYRVRFYMTGYELLAGESYCIVVEGVPPWSGSSFVWNYVKDNGAYARGVRSWYDVLADYWIVCPDDDHVFAEFGRPLEPLIPPGPGPDPPPIPPEPPINLWLVVKRKQHRTATGERMVAITNTPCHLWFRWTATPSRIHRIGRRDRGLTTMGDLYYCFDNYQDIEQAELGDTFLHNFLVEPWPYCEKRYYYYHGTISGEPSKSTSPIFYKHPKVPPDVMAFATGFDDNSLVAFDLTEPDKPKYHRQIRGAGAPKYLGKPYGLAGKGNYMYVCARGDSSLTVVDVTDPRTMSVVASIRGGGPPNYLAMASDVFILGDFAFVVAPMDDALVIIDISDPLNPTLAGSIRGAGPPNYLHFPTSVAVSHYYAYVAASLDDSLTVIDVSNPYHPVFVASIRGAGDPNYLNGINSVFVKNNYAYVTASFDDALTIIDIRNASKPTFASSIQGPPLDNYLNGASDVVMASGYAYVTAQYNNALVIFNVQDRSAPQYRGQIKGIGPPNYLWGASHVSVKGDYAYVSSYRDHALSTFDISDPDDPQLTRVTHGAGPRYYLSGTRSNCITWKE